MIARPSVLVIAGLCLLAAPMVAQGRSAAPGTGGGHSGGVSTGAHGGARPQGNIGGPRGPVGWGAFHHDTSPARVSPHRYGSTNLPRPNSWRGNYQNFDFNRWKGGQWQHANHNGRFGWWWVTGPDWYFFDAPVYPYPDLYTPLNEPFGWWYWCDTYQEYYPYVTYCPVPWESVMPRE